MRASFILSSAMFRAESAWAGVFPLNSGSYELVLHSRAGMTMGLAILTVARIEVELLQAVESEAARLLAGPRAHVSAGSLLAAQRASQIDLAQPEVCLRLNISPCGAYALFSTVSRDACRIEVLGSRGVVAPLVERLCRC